MRICLSRRGRVGLTGSSWRWTEPAASYQPETLCLEDSHLDQLGADTSCTPQVENPLAQQSAAALPCTIASENAENTSVSLALPMDSKKGCIDRQPQKPQDWGGWGMKELQLLPEMTNSDTEMPRNKVLSPPPTPPSSAGIHFTNLYC